MTPTPSSSAETSTSSSSAHHGELHARERKQGNLKKMSASAVLLMASDGRGQEVNFSLYLVNAVYVLAEALCTE